MEARLYWQLDPDLRAVLPRVWKTWELYREDLASFSGFAQLAGEALGDEVEVVSDGPARMGRTSPKLRVSLEGLTPLVRAPFEGRGWPYLFTATYLLANPSLAYLLGGTAGAGFILGKYAPELSAAKTQLQGGAAWGVAWLDWAVRGRAHDAAWRLSGGHDPALGAGLAEYALLGAQYGGDGEALFLLPRYNRRERLNYRTLPPAQPLDTGLPYGALELEEAEAYPVGRVEEGRFYLGEVSTVLQMLQALSWSGLGRQLQLRALQLPELGTQTLPSLRYALTDWAVRLAGATALSFRAGAAWDRTRQEYPPYEAGSLARLLVGLARPRAAEHTAAVARSLWMALGVGLPRVPRLAALVREAQSVPPWESLGHRAVSATLEVLRRPQVAAAFAADFTPRLQAARQDQASIAAEILSQTLDTLLKLKPEEALWHAPEALRRLADCAITALLYDLASTGGERYAKLGELYARRFVRGEPYPAWANQPSLWGVASQAGSTRLEP